MRKRILSILLCLCVLTGSFSFFIVPAGAVLPLGIAESALVSYMSSIGYKMYTDPSVEAAGQSILSGISSLYSDFISTATLTDFALQTLIDSNLVYLDNQNNFVVTKAAADVFQQFGEWLQEEYQIPDNTDNPTTVIQGEAEYTDGFGVVAGKYTFTNVGYYKSGSRDITVYYDDTILGYSNSSPVFLGTTESQYSNLSVYLTWYNNNIYHRSGSAVVYGAYVLGDSGRSLFSSYNSGNNKWGMVLSSPSSVLYSNIPVSSTSPTSSSSISAPLESELASGLGLSIAQSVVDQAAKAKDDDAVVLGVGAQAGMTAQDIVDIVSQAVLDRTLDPDVSITAVAVIDTPVQQFPDQDDLGLPKLGNALIRRFPFCIPFDLVDTWQAIVHAPVPPVMTIDIIPASVKAKVGVTADTSFELNLASPSFSTLLFIVRWGCIISFCLALERLTKRFIWTTGG